MPLTKKAQALLDALLASPDGDAICALYQLTRVKKTSGRKKGAATPYAFAGSYAYMERLIAEMEANGERRNLSEAARRAKKQIEADIPVFYTVMAAVEMRKRGEKRDLKEAARRGMEQRKADHAAGKIAAHVLQIVSASTIRNRYMTVRRAITEEDNAARIKK